MRRSWLATALFIALMLTIACGGGSGGSGGVVPGGSGGSTNLVLSFQAAEPSPGALSVAMSEVPGAADDEVTVRIAVTDVNDVFGAGFDVLFDPAQVAYVRMGAGSLLETVGSPVYQVLEVQPGQLVVGIACPGCSTGADASGTVALIDMTFQVVDDNTTGSALTFASADLLDSQPPAPGPIPGLSWFGGNLVAN